MQIYLVFFWAKRKSVHTTWFTVYTINTISTKSSRATGIERLYCGRKCQHSTKEPWVPLGYAFGMIELARRNFFCPKQATCPLIPKRTRPRGFQVPAVMASN